jgi:hypothetical protein
MPVNVDKMIRYAVTSGHNLQAYRSLADTGRVLKLPFRSIRPGIFIVWKGMQLREPENTNHDLANNGSLFSTVSTVTRIPVVIPSSLGSV